MENINPIADISSTAGLEEDLVQSEESPRLQSEPESEYDSQAWSETSERSSDWSNPILEPLKPIIVRQIIFKLRADQRFIRKCPTNNQQETTRQRAAGRSEPQASVSISDAHSPKRKRKSPNDERDHSDDDEYCRQRPAGRSSHESHSPEKLLACPFCKWKPQDYRKCYKFVLKDIARVKQHLSRCHRIPIHCALCFSIFDLEENRDEHLRTRECELRPPVTFEGVNEIQRKQLEQRVSKKKSKEENWYLIYDILFPNHRPPASPYVHSLLSEELGALQDFIAAEGPQLLSDLVRTELPHTLHPQREETEAFLQSAFQDVVEALLERWELRNQDLTMDTTRSSEVSSERDSGLGGRNDPRDQINEETLSLNIFSDFINDPDLSGFGDFGQSDYFRLD